MDWVTAIATVALAVLTGFYVWETRRIAKQAAESAEAAREAADSAERGVLIESMPLVIPHHGGGSRSNWKLVAENHGRSAAFSVLIEMYEVDEQRAFGSVVTDALGPGETWTGTMDESESATAFEIRKKEHRLEVWYVNAFGQQFRTTRSAYFRDGKPAWEFHTDVRDSTDDEWRRLY